MDEPDSNKIVSAFTEEQTARLTGCTVHQLRHWDRSDFFQPEYADPNRRVAFSRIYSFRDLLSLQILNTLRNDLGMSLQHLRNVKEKLAHLGEEKWSKTKLYVIKKEVAFFDEEREEKRAVISGQIVLEPIILEVVKANMLNSIRSMNATRDAQSVGKVERNKAIAHNQPVVAGTRIPVSSIQEFAKEGYTVDQIKREYPSLTEEDIKAAIEHKDAA